MGVKPEHVTRLRDGKLLIRAKSEKLAMKPKTIKNIPEPCGIAVKVIDHPTLNSCNRITRCPDIQCISEEEQREITSVFHLNTVTAVRLEQNDNFRLMSTELTVL